jgi:dihydrofolate reductase
MASSRRIVAFDWLSADGYFAGRDGNLNWVVPDDEQAKAAAAGMPAADTVLFGRRTYELFEGFWRHAQVTWNNARVVRGLDVDELAALKQLRGKTIMIFGSGSIVSQLTQHGLIDEYQFVVCPVFLGDGRRLLEGVSNSVKLELLESRKYPSGDVSLRYAPRAA